MITHDSPALEIFAIVNQRNFNQNRKAVLSHQVKNMGNCCSSQDDDDRNDDNARNVDDDGNDNSGGNGRSVNLDDQPYLEPGKRTHHTRPRPTHAQMAALGG